MGILEKIKDIEAEMAKTQKNKATEYHLGLLKAKLAKYRAMLLEPDGKSGEKGEGFDVMKSGDARCALIGFPSVGKSTLLNKMTGSESVAADYEFTTLTCIPYVSIDQRHWISCISNGAKRLTRHFQFQQTAARSTTKAQTSNCWICQESSRVHLREKEEAGRSLQLQRRPT